MPNVSLTAGRIEYVDTGGTGPVLVLLHGVCMDGTLWRHVVAELSHTYRCICPTLPLGSHREAMSRPELVTHRGVAAMVGEFLAALDLEDVTLVLNDWGGALFLLADGPRERVTAAALVACEAFDNFPPGRPGRTIANIARIPQGLWLAMQLQRFGWFRRAPGGWGWMSKRPVPAAVMDQWFRPVLVDRQVRRDLRTFALSTPSLTERAALMDRVRAFPGPVLVAWAPEDRLMPREHGPRLAQLFARSRFVEIEDSYTLVPEDQPEQLAEALASFMEDDVASYLRRD